MSELLNNCNYKVLKNNSDYAIVDDGRLYSFKVNRFLKGQIMASGYLRYVITKDNIKYRFWAHRLVAEYFIENPENKPIVNHKDLNKLNNNKDNLEWVTIQENTQHAADNNLLTKKSKREYLTANNENEIWKEIKDYPNYKISNKGRVINNKGLILKQWTRGTGDYQLITLHNALGKKNFSIHVLEYYTFNPDEINSGDYIIDHIDGVKNNNNLENLRRISQKENVKAGYYEQKVNSRSKRIAAYKVNDKKYYEEFNSYAEAGRKLNLNDHSIRQVAIGERKTTGGYYFKLI